MPTSNQLSDALSPYLLQHADNPVHWYPWNEEALELARRLDRPILLSVGYSACHWCHVMARESFADPDIAERMNRDFINVKVDREERPDLDRIYQLSHQLLTGQPGGWPLTVFLDPDTLAPFFAGTYYPPEPRHGQVAFPELLARIDRAWKTRRGQIEQQNDRLIQALESLDRAAPQAELPTEHLAAECVSHLSNFFDSLHGGFGQGPKFPQAPALELLRDRALQGDESARYMLFGSLTSMARSGLADHVGGGFFRYCVDGRWEIPHFEKMLSDNAQLLPLFAETSALWAEPGLEAAAEHIVGWLDSEMSLDDGGLAASLDADTPDGEGAFYLWSPEEVRGALDSEEAEWVISRFGLDRPANHESGRWHLLVRPGGSDSGDESGSGAMTDEVRTKLNQARRRRPAPARDDKILASWNGLAAAGLIRAGRVLDRPRWCTRGLDLLDFLIREMLEAPDGPWSVMRDGRRTQRAHLDDLAAVVRACMEALQLGLDPTRLDLAQRLVKQALDDFRDPTTGVFYLTARDHESLLTRPRSQADESTPAGGGLLVHDLLRLARLVGPTDWIDLAEKSLATVGPDLREQPTTHATWIRALVEFHQPAPQVLLAGPGHAEWLAQLRRRPGLACYPVTEESAGLDGPAGELATSTRARAVVCHGRRCLEPAESPEALAAQLEQILHTEHPA